MSKRYSFSGYETMASGYTNGMYLPNKPLDEWNFDECRRALCRQANGDVMRCLDCENKCRYGNRIEVLLSPAEVTEDQAKNKHVISSEAQKKGAEANRKKAEIKYLRIIASGDPKAYLESHGMSIHNNMSRIRIAYKGVTPEEARKRLAEMGAEFEELHGMPVNATETQEEQTSKENREKSTEERQVHESAVQTEEAELNEPVKCDGVKLQIHTVTGKYFRYTRNGGGALEITPNTICVASNSEVDAICNEIKAAFEMMRAN